MSLAQEGNACFPALFLNEVSLSVGSPIRRIYGGEKPGLS